MTIPVTLILMTIALTILIVILGWWASFIVSNEMSTVSDITNIIAMSIAKQVREGIIIASYPEVIGNVSMSIFSPTDLPYPQVALNYNVTLYVKNNMYYVNITEIVETYLTRSTYHAEAPISGILNSSEGYLVAYDCLNLNQLPQDCIVDNDGVKILDNCYCTWSSSIFRLKKYVILKVIKTK